MVILSCVRGVNRFQREILRNELAGGGGNACDIDDKVMLRISNEQCKIELTLNLNRVQTGLLLLLL